jgi:hypothetical protein
MRLRIGLGVSSDEVRAVALDDGRVLWVGESIVESKSLRAVVADLLATAPRRRWSRPTIVAAIGPARAQLRRLSGLPPAADAASLRRMVADNAGHFFLRTSVPLVTTGVRRDGDSEGWSAAIEQPVITELDAACRAAGARLLGVLSSLSVISRVLPGDDLTWQDGQVCAHLVLADGRLRSVRRTYGVAPAPNVDTPASLPALEVLGAEGWRFADAYGAALASINDPLLHHPTPSTSVPVPAWRCGLAGAACAIALASALLVQPLIARRAAAESASALSAMAGDRREAVAMESSLARVSGALGEIAAFDRGRRAMTFLLADLARLLPTGSALVTLRTDSVGGTIVALAPRAAPLIEKLEQVRGIATVTIVGPVTREVAGAAEVERVTIAFRWNAIVGTAAQAASRATR